MMSIQSGIENYTRVKNATESVLDTVVVDALLKGQIVVIPDFGYLELKSFADRRSVLFKVAESKDLPSTMVFEGLENTDYFSVLSDSISKPLKEGKVVSMPNLGIFRPLKREDGRYHVSFTTSSFLRKRLNGENTVNKEYHKDTTVPDNTEEATVALPPVELPVVKSATQAFNHEKKETDNISREEIQHIDKLSRNKNTAIEATATVFSVVNKDIEQKPGDLAPLLPEVVEEGDGKRRIISEKILFLFFLIVFIVIVLLFFLSKKEDKDVVNSNLELSGASINLVDLAKENYGNAAFWVYIYDKNQDKLTSPINIPKGIKLTIPDLSEYNIDIRDSMEIIRANIRSESILQKYKNRL
jgi:nucleoid DNA-binding protein